MSTLDLQAALDQDEDVLQRKRRRLLLGMSGLPPPHHCYPQKARTNSLSTNQVNAFQHEWEILRKTKPIHREILDLEWIEARPDEDENTSLLVACTSLGEVLVWTGLSSNLSTDETGQSSGSRVCKRIQISTQTLRSVTTTESAAKDGALFIGGDDGLWCINVSTLKKMACKSNFQENDLENFQRIPLHNRSVHQILFHPDLRALLLLVDNGGQILVCSIDQGVTIVNSISIGVSRNDSTKGTTMALVPAPSSSHETSEDSSSNSLLLVGTNDSKVWIWKTPQSDPKASFEKFDSLLLDGKKSYTNILSVSSILTSLDGSWWTVSGIYRPSTTVASSTANLTSATTTSTSNKALGGCLMTWHGPSRKMIATMETPEQIHQIAAGAGSSLYTVSNEGAVSRWKSSYQLEQVSKVSVSMPCGLSAKVLPSTKHGESSVVVAGVGSNVDILAMDCRVDSLEAPST